MDVSGLTLRDIVHKFSSRDKAEAAAKLRAAKRARLAENLLGEPAAASDAGGDVGGRGGGVAAIAVATPAAPTPAQFTPQVGETSLPNTPTTGVPTKIYRIGVGAISPQRVDALAWE